jgi:16S rRNA (uracil1498-N3)-methyltransferase
MAASWRHALRPPTAFSVSPRLFVEGDLACGVEAALGAPQHHYLRHVLRCDDGAPLRVFNGRDGEWQACLELRGRKAGTARVGQRLREQVGEPDVWLCFAPIKRARIDYLAEKATELGAALLQPVLTRHTAVDRVNLERLRANAIEAAEQTERLSVPQVRDPRPLAQLLAEWPDDRRLLMCDETGGGRPIAEALLALAPAERLQPWAIVLGPEGGFDRSELAALRGMRQVLAVGLGPRILRADTAALAALACWQALVGDWQRPTPRLAGDYRASRAAV